MLTRFLYVQKDDHIIAVDLKLVRSIDLDGVKRHDWNRRTVYIRRRLLPVVLDVVLLWRLEMKCVRWLCPSNSCGRTMIKRGRGHICSKVNSGKRDDKQKKEKSPEKNFLHSFAWQASWRKVYSRLGLAMSAIKRKTTQTNQLSSPSKSERTNRLACAGLMEMNAKKSVFLSWQSK